jgi:hypothetical protein
MSKPTLGYTSRTDAIVALRSQGYSTLTIAKKTGIKAGTVAVLEHYNLRGRRTDCANRQVMVRREIMDTLGPIAAKRGLSVKALAQMIIETVISEHMVEAVLDDGAEP